MAVFNIVVNVVLVVAALATVWFAWQAGRESRKATEAALETAKSSQAAATAAQQAVETSRQMVEHARETVDVAKAAHAADERDRTIRQLRDIAGLVERIFLDAQRERDHPQPREKGVPWRSPDQMMLGQALAALGLPLPRCKLAVGESQAASVMVAARDAREEVRQSLAAMHAG